MVIKKNKKKELPLKKGVAKRIQNKRKASGRHSLRKPN